MEKSTAMRIEFHARAELYTNEGRGYLVGCECETPVPPSWRHSVHGGSKCSKRGGGGVVGGCGHRRVGSRRIGGLVHHRLRERWKYRLQFQGMPVNCARRFR